MTETEAMIILNQSMILNALSQVVEIPAMQSLLYAQAERAIKYVGRSFPEEFCEQGVEGMEHTP